MPSMSKNKEKTVSPEIRGKVEKKNQFLTYYNKNSKFKLR